ncbi:MAG: aspartate--tRNA(Asn) ligase [Patescibacteria group bacterium]
MTRTLLNETPKKIGEEVLVKGWVNARRNMGKIVFIDLRDRSGLAQIVLVPGELDDASKELLSDLRPEFVLEIEGVVNERNAKQKNDELATGGVEILAKKVKILASAETLPYDLNADLLMTAYLDNLPFNLRADKQRAIFKIQTALIQGFRNFLLKEQFTEFQCPKIVAGATEGGANVFAIDYFGKRAFLAQSPQFYKQIMTGVFERVFTTGNVYRAEEHDTNRHINEYTSLDFEMGFINDYTDVKDMVEETAKAMIRTVQENCVQEIKFLGTELPNLDVKFPTMKLKEAQKLLEDEFGEKNATKEPDLEPHQEKMIAEYAKKKFNSDFIFITHYPVEKRPMYTMEDEADPGFTKSFDLIFRGTEIVTGGQRIHDYEKLKANMIKFGLKPEGYQYYLQAFKYGMPPEGGIAIGLERITWRLLGLDSIKQATLFPRDCVRIDEPLSKNN